MTKSSRETQVAAKGVVDPRLGDLDSIIAANVKMTFIAAMDVNRLIGKDNDLPWKLPGDLKHFKETTLGHPLLLGSNTWRSFGSRALPKRHHTIVTSKPDEIEVREQDVENVTKCTDLNLAVQNAKGQALQAGVGQFFVIGGASIYEQLIDKADRMIITEVSGDYEGDTWFPRFGSEWTVVDVSFIFKDEATDTQFQIITYER